MLVSLTLALDCAKLLQACPLLSVSSDVTDPGSSSYALQTNVQLCNHPSSSVHSSREGVAPRNVHTCVQRSLVEVLPYYIEPYLTTEFNLDSLARSAPPQIANDQHLQRETHM